MTELFRFATLRSPQSVSDDVPLPLDAPTAFQRGLAEAAPRPGTHGTIGRMVALARAYLKTDAFVAKVSALKWGAKLQAALDAIAANSPASVADFTALITTAMGAPATLAGDKDLQADDSAARDAIIAAYLAPEGHYFAMSGMANVVRVIDLIRRVAGQDPKLAAAGAIAGALNRPVALPEAVFVKDPTKIQPVGVADLLVVRQHIKGYELGEIATIENIAKGESRKKTDRHTTTADTTQSTETTSSTETEKEQTTSDRFNLKNEIDKQMKEDLGIKAGASVAYHGGMVDASVNFNLDYSTSKTESQKISSEYAKEVTSRASTKVTETLKQTLIQQFVETFDTLEDHGFDNTQGLDNVSAVYQFVDKVYAAQVFNYGKRLLYDLIVPEPAAQWLEARWLKPVDPNAPAGPPPLDLSLTPASLTADTYAAAVAKYRASGVAPPPKSLETAGTTLVSTPDQKANDAPGTIKVPEGYEASYAWVTGNYDWTDGNANSIGVYLGDKVVGFNQNDGPQIVNFTLPAMGDIPVGLHAYHVSNYTITIRVFCLPSQDAIAKWQNDAFDKILLGWAKWNSDYQDALARAQQDVPTGDPKFGTNPETNQEIARLELKRNVLQMMIGEVAQKSITPPPPNPPAPSFPQPAMPDALAHGEIIRFFEQAFEWEQVSYVCYPYFWGRKQETWYDKLRLTSDDPEFQQFLRAGAARTVIPVRRGYEDALTYFFATGQLWKGGEPPQVSDPNYLPIAQEIKELTGAPGDEVPYGPQWEIQLPTQLVRLRADGKLPVWKQPDPNVWTWTSDDGS